MRKLLLKLRIIQEKRVKDRFNITTTKRRINPYNPLSYIALLLIILIGIVMFGFVGVWDEVDLQKPFNYRK